MRKKLQSCAQRPEEIGKQIAGEFDGFFKVAARRVLEDEERARQTAETMETLRSAIYRAVCGFNTRAPREFQLAILDRGDRLIFNSCGQFTLTLSYGMRQVMIEAEGESLRGMSTMVLDLWREDGALRFRAIPDAEMFPAPILTEDQFVCSVVRMACNRRWSGRTEDRPEC